MRFAVGGANSLKPCMAAAMAGIKTKLLFDSLRRYLPAKDVPDMLNETEFEKVLYVLNRY